MPEHHLPLLIERHLQAANGVLKSCDIDPGRVDHYVLEEVDEYLRRNGFPAQLVYRICQIKSTAMVLNVRLHALRCGDTLVDLYGNTTWDSILKFAYQQAVADTPSAKQKHYSFAGEETAEDGSVRSQITKRHREPEPIQAFMRDLTGALAQLHASLLEENSAAPQGSMGKPRL